MDGYEWGKNYVFPKLINNVEIYEKKNGSYGELGLQAGYNVQILRNLNCKDNVVALAC